MNAFPRRGVFYWVEIPGEPGRKRRPALVISLNARNRFADDVLIIPASTTLRPAPTHVHLKKGTGGLARESVLKCEQVTTLSKRFVSDTALGGEISGALLEDVERGVLRAIGVPA
ncbi:MAG TPA: type II toxin-antitoxin system PemK/MazF family toxin [Thermoanaerobaculia bacterium]|nr:type II toxin-antitoxin system PemK/MazF family toxin [Thermoanaerobaculia bacterium]